MKELKFRVWEEREKAYNTWSYVLDTIGNLFRNAYGALIGCDKKDYIVEQFTGFKDANGKEVYEGDVIRYKVLRDDCSTRHGYKYREVIEVVEYDDELGEYLVGLYSPLGTIANHYEPEVIGNVHENGDLIGGEE